MSITESEPCPSRHNVGHLNIDEYLRRLIELSKTLAEEEQRAVTDGLTEEELAAIRWSR